MLMYSHTEQLACSLKNHSASLPVGGAGFLATCEHTRAHTCVLFLIYEVIIGGNEMICAYLI